MEDRRFYQGYLETDRNNYIGLEKYKDWLIGNFDKFDGDIRKTDLLELKYWVIKKGEEKNHRTKVQKTVGEITIILEGKAKGFIEEKNVTLEKGKYFFIPPDVINNLIVEVIEGKEISGITLKAPSKPGDEIKK